MGDLKPEPVLWHEDSGRKPWENGRQYPKRHLSGHQLGEASHRLVTNSLQLKGDRVGFGSHSRGPPLSYAAAPYIPQVPSYSNSEHNDLGRLAVVPPPIADYTRGNHQRSSNPNIPNPYDNGYERRYYSGPQMPYNGSHSQYQRNAYHPPGFHQNDVTGYQPRHVQNISPGIGTYTHHQGGFNGYQTYQTPGAGNYQHQATHNYSRGHSHPHDQQGGNPYSALDRRGNTRPRAPHPGYDRK